MTLTFLLDKVCLKHNSGYGHPENSKRIINILSYFNSKGNEIDIKNSDVTNPNQLNTIFSNIHEQQLRDKVFSSKNQNQTFFDHDTIANKHTYEASTKSANLAISAALLSSIDNSFFSIMRPPGHHATRKKAMGFCYFNNIALAAQSQLAKNRKITIIDFDFHYGNGTADIFWENSDVLYISLHADPTVNYPNQGFIDEIGSKDGRGYNVCIPLTLGASNNEVLYFLQKFVFPILDEFKPDIIGISAGFDAFKYDPVGGGYLTYDKKGFSGIGHELFQFTKTRKIPIFHILEGGYNLDHLPNLIYEYSKPWLSNKSLDIKTIDKNEIKSKEKKTAKYLRQLFKSYWNLS
jgi:acetoin utilization deacetylase AcuC-like enzyme